MPDVHVPKFDEHSGGKAIVKTIFEVVMIGIGVFLGLAGDQWREARHQRELAMQGIRPANFDRSAWDLAIATQSLAYIDPALALSLSRVYNTQEISASLARGLTQSMYTMPPVDDARATTFFGAVMLYYDDMKYYDEGLLKLYDDILPQLNKALGENKT